MTIIGAVTGSLNVGGDHDWFKVTLSANTLYAFSAVTQSGNPYIEPNLVIYDAAGKIVDQLDADNFKGGVLGSLGFMPTTSGTYYVDISSQSDTAYAYSLTLNAVADDYQNNLTTSGTLAVNSTKTGNINVGGDHDWFKVTLSANTLYAFSAVTQSGNPYIEPNLVIYDAAGKIVDQLDADNFKGGVLGSLGFMPTTSGTYYVDISSQSDTAYAYSLTLNAVADDYQNNLTTSGTLAVNSTKTGNINVGGDHDWFKVTLSANTLYAFSAVTQSGNPYIEPNLVIYDAAGKIVDQLDADNFKGGVLGSLGFMPTTSGTYYVDISSQSDTAYAYSLTLNAVADDYQNNLTTSGTLAVNSTKTGNINVGGDHDWFKVTLSANTLYAFSAVTQSGNPYIEPNLVIYDAAGKIVDQLDADNFKGGVLGSLGFMPTTSGTYYVDISSQSDTAYAYSLTLNAVADDYRNNVTTTGVITNSSSSSTMYSISPGTTTVSEAAGTASFTITRSGLLPAETLYVSTAQTEGTLNIGDYSGKLNEALSFAAGQTSRTVTVSITNDTVLENDETFGFVVQRNASDLLNTYLAKLTFTIHSDDGKTLDDYSSTISTTGTITAGQTKQGTINFIGDTDWFKTSLVAGTDYQFELKGASSGSGTLTDPFLRLRDSAGNPVPLAFADDGGTGFDSRFTFTPLTDGTYFLAAGTGYHENGMGTYALTQSVRSNAAGTSYKLTPPLPAVGEASGSLTFTLTRSGVLPSETVFASTVFGLKNGYADNTGNSDYTGLNNLGISFAAGQPSKTFSINIHEDALAEGNETFGVIIQAAPDPSINNWLARSSFTILDNEAGQSSFRLSPLELVGDEASGHISVTLTRPAGLAQETVYVSTGAQPSGPANDDDYLERNQYPLTFGQNQEEQTFDIQLLTDNVSEPWEKFNLSVWRSANQNPQDFILRSPFTIVDADDPTRLPDAKTIFFNHKGMAGVLADLMFAAYDFKDSAKIAETFNGLKIEALDLGNLTGYRRNGDQPTGVFVNDNASAIVGRSSDAIFLSFTGTDNLLLDGFGNAGWLQRENHYHLFNDFITAVDDYASTVGIKHIYVTGHSLGAAMAQAYMADHEDKDGVEYEAVVFANPGYGESLGGIGVGLNQPDTRMSNILIAGDIISVPNSLSPVRGDQYIIPTELLASDAALGSYAIDLHDQALYAEIGPLLESLYSQFPIRSFAQNMAPETIHLGGMYVDAIPPFPPANPSRPGLVPHQYQEADITYALAKETSGQTTGVFSFANSAPVTVNMDTGQIYYSTPLSVVSVMATAAAELGAVGAGLVDIGTPLKNVVVGTAVAGEKALNIIGNAWENFIGGGLDDYIYAAGGDDIIDIGVGDGPDVYDGGDDVDTLIYASTTLGVVIDLSLASNNATGIEIAVDQIANIENIVGGSGPDSITGSNADNNLKGGAGNDTLDGGSGVDTAIFSGLSASYSVTKTSAGYTVNDNVGSDGTDTLTNVERLQFMDKTIAFDIDGKMVSGGAGNDILVGGAGNDTLDGGAGLDTALFSGISAGYTLTRTASGMTAASASDGTDALINIERLQFTDKTLAFDLDGNAGQAYRLYQAAFDRVPDQGGLGYWINEIDRGTGLSQAATGFINSAEFKALYGNNPSNSEFVTLIYDNVLHRTPDAGGYSYWMEQLSSGMTRENVLIGFSESTENKGALMAFSMDGNMGKDYRLYQAAFDRKPDVSGLDYWYHQMNSGVTLQQVASGFINSAEFKALYGNNPSNAELVTLLYDNVLHRAPDTGGFNYWINELDHGTSREDVLIGFSESLENQLSLVGIVQTGIEYV